MAIPVSELQKIAPSSIIELFELQLVTALHGSNTTYRFHAGSNMDANGELVWNSNSYQRFPVEAEGFEYTGTGSLPPAEDQGEQYPRQHHHDLGDSQCHHRRQ
jgi:lambda family phage minor tail protein L